MTEGNVKYRHMTYESQLRRSALEVQIANQIKWEYSTEPQETDSKPHDARSSMFLNIFQRSIEEEFYFGGSIDDLKCTDDDLSKKCESQEESLKTFEEKHFPVAKNKHEQKPMQPEQDIEIYENFPVKNIRFPGQFSQCDLEEHLKKSDFPVYENKNPSRKLRTDEESNEEQSKKRQNKDLALEHEMNLKVAKKEHVKDKEPIIKLPSQGKSNDKKLEKCRSDPWDSPSPLLPTPEQQCITIKKDYVCEHQISLKVAKKEHVKDREPIVKLPSQEKSNDKKLEKCRSDPWDSPSPLLPTPVHQYITIKKEYFCEHQINLKVPLKDDYLKKSELPAKGKEATKKIPSQGKSNDKKLEKCRSDPWDSPSSLLPTPGQQCITIKKDYVCTHEINLKVPPKDVCLKKSELPAIDSEATKELPSQGKSHSKKLEKNANGKSQQIAEKIASDRQDSRGPLISSTKVSAKLDQQEATAHELPIKKDEEVSVRKSSVRDDLDKIVADPRKIKNRDVKKSPGQTNLYNIKESQDKQLMKERAEFLYRFLDEDWDSSTVIQPCNKISAKSDQHRDIANEFNIGMTKKDDIKQVHIRGKCCRRPSTMFLGQHPNFKPESNKTVGTQTNFSMGRSSTGLTTKTGVIDQSPIQFVGLFLGFLLVCAFCIIIFYCSHPKEPEGYLQRFFS